MALAVLHHHPHTGLPCDCRYGKPKFLSHRPRTSGVNWNRALKGQAQGKKFQALEGAQAFLGWMNELMTSDGHGWRDEIAPFLLKEFRAGRITFDENRRAFYPEGENGGWSTRLTDHIADLWGRWAAARQHPTRRGVNITAPDFTTAHIMPLARQFREDMEQRARKQHLIEEMKHSQAPVAYKFNDGWTVRDLAQANDPRGEMELEGAIMDHCIGNTGNHPFEGYDYADAVGDGLISHVYSLRDPEGLSHATFHHNADGSLAEINGYNDQDSALNKYAPRIAHFFREVHPDVLGYDADTYTAEDMRNGNHPWVAHGNDFERPSPFPPSFDVSAPTGLDELRGYHEAMQYPNSEALEELVEPEYFEAVANGHDPELEWGDPNWEYIAKDLVRQYHQRDPNGEDPEAFLQWLHDANPRWYQELRSTLEHHYTTGVDNPRHTAEPILTDMLRMDRDRELQRKVNEAYPGAANPNPLFHDVPRNRAEDSYSYPVTDPGVGFPDDQYLAPSDKRRFQVQALKLRMQEMRDQGQSWAEISAAHGAGGYNDEHSLPQQALREARQTEYENARSERRELHQWVQQQQEAQAPGDTFEPYSMAEVQNHARQLHWQAMVNQEGLSPDAASARIIDYERQVRNNPNHCQTCGDFGGQHTRDCPVDPRNQVQPEPPQQQQLPGTFSAAHPSETEPWSEVALDDEVVVGVDRHR